MLTPAKISVVNPTVVFSKEFSPPRWSNAGWGFTRFQWHSNACRIYAGQPMFFGDFCQVLLVLTKYAPCNSQRDCTFMESPLRLFA